MAIIWFLVFVLGLCSGSFINCVVFRLNHNLSPLRGRSICPKCRHQLSWRDNIPLLSFVLLGRKCRYCHCPISWQYPLVEITAGLLSLAVFKLLGFDLRVLVYYLLVTYSLLTIFVSDLRYGTIPDETVAFGTLITLVFLVLLSPTSLALNFIAAVVTSAFFLFLVLITRGRGMGMGDAKLAFFMGLFLGFPNILTALFLAFLTGATVGVILIFSGKKRFGQTIPFGPFLCMATWVAMFWGERIMASYEQWVLR